MHPACMKLLVYVIGALNSTRINVILTFLTVEYASMLQWYVFARANQMLQWYVFARAPSRIPRVRRAWV